jgi:hypothetical protein
MMVRSSIVQLIVQMQISPFFNISVIVFLFWHELPSSEIMERVRHLENLPNSR